MSFAAQASLQTSVGDQDPEHDPDPHVFGFQNYVFGSGSGIGSFPFSHKCIERTEIMPAKSNFSIKLNFFN